MHHRFIATLLAGALSLTTTVLGLSSGARAAGPEATSPVPNDTATVTAPTSFAPGEALTIRGHGWLNDAKNRGSIIGIKFDSDPGAGAKTVYTRRDVTNPDTGSVTTDKSMQAIAAANAQGDWSVTIPAPTPATAFFGGATGSPAIDPWASGQVHSFRLLTGSLGSAFGDTPRSVRVEFCVGNCDTPAGTKPSWGHLTATHADGATAWVEESPSTASGALLRVKGKGWLSADQSTGSTVDISFARGGSGDTGLPYLTTADADGNFQAEVPLPTGLKAGDYLSATFRSGPYAAGDTARTVTTATLKVGGVAYVPPVAGGTTCTPTTSGPVVKLGATSAPLGGSISVTGTGWCHPTNGGSVVAVKIDDGATSRLESTKVKDDLTIWAFFEADPKTGAFSGQITLPDGTSATSKPALAHGAHTFRFLSGTMKTGDKIRTLESAEFTVGAYSPHGPADPVEATEDLVASAKGKLKIARGGNKLTVSVPNAQVGEWIYLNVYDTGSPLFPWKSTWLRADARKQVRVSLKGIDLPAGELKLTAQSGNLGTIGELLGWGVLKIAGTTTTPTTGAVTTVSPASLLPSVGSTPAPAEAPKTPVLTEANRGVVVATVTGTGSQLTVLLKTTAPFGSWIHVTLFNGETAVPVGWLQARMDGSVTLDAASLPAGEYRLAVQGPLGTVIGWTSVTLGTQVAGSAPAATTTNTTNTAATTTTTTAAAVATLSATPVLVSQSLPLWRVRDLDAILMVAAIGILAGTALGVGLGVRPRRKLS